MSASFAGAIQCANGILQLRGTQAVYFDAFWNASSSMQNQSVLMLYYDEAIQMYALTPLMAHTVFLPSGQPLGRARLYALRRGTEICLSSGQNRAVLL